MHNTIAAAWRSNLALYRIQEALGNGESGIQIAADQASFICDLSDIPGGNNSGILLRLRHNGERLTSEVILTKHILSTPAEVSALERGLAAVGVVAEALRGQLGKSAPANNLLDTALRAVSPRIKASATLPAVDFTTDQAHEDLETFLTYLLPFVKDPTLEGLKTFESDSFRIEFDTSDKTE